MTPITNAFAHRQTERGFTLVEVAVTVTIIGLLLAAVMKGREVYDNARGAKLIVQVKTYENAFVDFQKMYKFLPGDIPDPQARLPNCTASPCNLAGNGNGSIDGGSSNMWFVADYIDFGMGAGETRRTWLQMSKAGLVDGIDKNYPATYGSVNPVQPGVDYPAAPWPRVGYDVFFWHEGASGVPAAITYEGGHYIKTKSMPAGATMGQGGLPVIPATIGRMIDVKIDDGNPSRGKVVAWSFVTMSGLTDCQSAAGVYQNLRTSTCELAIKMDF